MPGQCYSFTYSSAIYGKPAKLTLNGPNGPRQIDNGVKAYRLHTRIYCTVETERQALLKELYDSEGTNGN